MTVPARPRWYVAPRILAAPRARLVCLPHAGAGASVYQPWAAAWAAEGIEVRAVQYPGRETRWGEPLLTSASGMAGQLAQQWDGLGGADGVPVVIYGHSMGVLVALELMRALEARGRGAEVRHLVLAARNPPHVPRLHPPIHRLDDGAFLDAVAARYGNLPAVLLADEEMRALITPVLKADFQLVDEYEVDPRGSPVRVPLTILGGAKDPFTSAAALAEWARYTAAGCVVREVGGGHFFHQEAREATWAELRPILSRI